MPQPTKADLEKVEHIGLNGKADNEVALACYKKLSFGIVAPCGEFTVEQTTSLFHECT